MQIQRIHIENYKTYLDLDLDVSVSQNRPIVLISENCSILVSRR